MFVGQNVEAEETMKNTTVTNSDLGLSRTDKDRRGLRFVQLQVIFNLSLLGSSDFDPYGIVSYLLDQAILPSLIINPDTPEKI